MPLMPRSVYWPLRHMSPSPAAAAGQGHRIGPPHDADNAIAHGEAAAGRRRDHLPVGFMAGPQAAGAGRRFAVSAADDFTIGAADAECEAADQERAMRLQWLWNVVKL